VKKDVMAVVGSTTIARTTGFNGDGLIEVVDTPPSMGGAMTMTRMAGSGPPGMPATPETITAQRQGLVAMNKRDFARLTLGMFATSQPVFPLEFAYGGQAEAPDGKAHVIDVKGSEGFAARLFIDEQTNLPRMVTYQAPQPRMMTFGGPAGRMGGAPGHQLTDEERKKIREDAEKQIQELQKQPPTMVDYTLFVDDWRSVDGVKFPHSLRRASAGTTNEEWTVSRVKVNPKIDPKKFEG